MKNTIYLICFSLMGLGTISCQKEQMATEPASSQDPIVFSAQALQTKGESPLDNLEALMLKDFSVSAWYTPDEKEFGDGSEIPYIANHRFGTLDGEIAENTIWQGISRDDANAKTPNPVYYPLDGSLSFFCYAPYSEISESSNIRFINNPEEAITSQLTNYIPNSPLIQFAPAASPSEQIDFVASEPVLNWKKGDGLVSLDFSKHLTTRLLFFCDYNGVLNNEEKIIVKSVQISNVIGSEYLYFTKDNDGVVGHQWCKTISPEDGSTLMPRTSYVLSLDRGELNPEAYLKKHITNSDYIQVNERQEGRMYVLPQEFGKGEGACDGKKDPVLFITYQIKNGENKTVEEASLGYDLRGTQEWEIGKTVAYYITLGVNPRKDLIVKTVVIEDWDDAGNTHNPEEILY